MDKITRMNRRRKSIRKRITGTGERPRMRINKSLNNIYVQIINDFENKTICGLSTNSQAVKDKISAVCRKNTSAATVLGKELAQLAASKGVKKVVFDRAGYKYHGVVKALAESARENGLEF